MVEHQKNGLLFEARNAKAIKETLELLLSDAELCQQLGTNARLTIENKFSISDSLNRLVEIYHGIL